MLPEVQLLCQALLQQESIVAAMPAGGSRALPLLRSCRSAPSICNILASMLLTLRTHQQECRHATGVC